MFKKDREVHRQRPVHEAEPTPACGSTNATDKDDYEAYICNGKAMYEYNGLEQDDHRVQADRGPGRRAATT